MRSALVVLGVLALAGGGAWWLLREAGFEAPLEEVDVPPPPQPTAQAPRSADGEEGPLRVEEPPLRRLEGERWREEVLHFKPGSGPVTGRDLLEALAEARVLHVRAATPDDLAALESAVLEGVPREEGVPVGIVEVLLRQAGFHAQVRYPMLGFGRPRQPTPDGPR